ncbi:MAG TPA: zinc ribbon domain-containing protein [Patescibacteria group bacterium]|jgi:hypothetical protein|nr:zinc ribbon domain-containing protein [Patescibacteria group bacterium]
MSTISNLFCADCGTELEDDSAKQYDDRRPCPKCFSKKRSFHVTVNEEVTIREMLHTKAKRQGEKKPFMEQKSGDDLFRKTGKWMKLLRIFDRDNDSYKELITDPKTGEIIHQKDEPLSQHRGYGSAKKK